MLNWFKKNKAETSHDLNENNKFESMSFADKLKLSITKTSGAVAAFFVHRKLDAQALGELEDALIMADLGPSLAAQLVGELAQQTFPPEQPQAAQQWLAQRLAAALPENTDWQWPPVTAQSQPQVVLMLGVNGSGKTTTLAKLAAIAQQAGLKVHLVAADTFRAAAIEQLQVWSQRFGCPVHAKHQGADPAAVAYEGVQAAMAQGADVVLIDTAGRLQTQNNLMAELQKIHKVIQKLDGAYPHQTLLTLDATAGQNAIAQAQAFHQAVPLSGLVITKLDGSAKAGFVLPLVQALPNVPVRLVGVGEKADDLGLFNPQAFVEGLVGL